MGDSSKHKRRRLQGACDICRQKKVRCDSATMPDNRCSNCIAFGAQCTHVHTSQKTIYKLNPSNKRGFKKDDSVEQRMAEMKPVIEAIMSPTYQAPSNPAVIRNTLVSLASYAALLEERLAKDPGGASSSGMSPEAPLPVACGMVNKLDPVEQLAEDVSWSMAINNARPQSRFFGPSSNASLVRTALDYGRELTGKASTRPGDFGLSQHKRPVYWTIQKWDIAPPKLAPSFTFPEPDLLEHLVEIYFRMVNNLVPVFHRPSFERSVRAGLHFEDPTFGQCLLAMCSVASRYSNDRRVLENPGDSELKAGVQWFRQITLFPESFVKAPSLYQLQMYWLATLYLHGTSTPEKCWYTVGLAIKAAQDAGIHRQDRELAPPTIETELQKRIWWTLLIADIVCSISVGRPRSTHALDYDIDLPLEVDDEYWEHPDPTQAFKQPPGKPSRITIMVKVIELMEILASAQDSFYSVNPPEGDRDWDQDTLASLDSTLNSWVDSIPPHLRWDPNRFDPFFDQSAFLFATYYWVQILVHFPFITRKNQLFLSSYAICTNASRACSRILDTHSKRGGLIAIPQIQALLLKAGVIVILSIWRGKQAGVTLNEAKEMESVHRCARVLGIFERRWHPAGRFNDVLRALSAASELPSPRPSTKSVNAPFAPAAMEQSSSPTGQAFQQPSPNNSPNFDYPMHSNQLSKPIFQSYQGPSTSEVQGSNPALDDFEAMFGEKEMNTYNAMALGLGEPAIPAIDTVSSSYSMLGTSGQSYTMNNSNPSAAQGTPLYDTSDWRGVPTDFDWNTWGAYLSTSNLQAMDFSQDTHLPSGFGRGF